MTNLIEDVSVLSTIPEKTVVKFFKKLCYCICEAVEEDRLNNKDISSLDLGIGVLHIKHTKNEEAKYKFIPSKYLRKAVSMTVEEDKNVLEDALNNSLIEKFTEVYKDLC